MRLTICDSTLRDGSHAKRHRFTTAEVVAIAGALDDAGVDIIEVSHGDGLGGSSFNYGFSLTDELMLIEAAAGAIHRASVAVLLLPGIGVKEDLGAAWEAGARVARIATHCTEADIAPSHLATARELGFTTVGFLMMAHMIDADHLAGQAKLMASAGAGVVYVTDSAGALTPSGVRDRVSALRTALPHDVSVGFHAHNNIGLAVGNSLAAVEAGATWIDGCTRGLGAGAGNAPTELLAAAFEREFLKSRLDPLRMMDVAEEVVRPVMDGPQEVDRSALLLGYAGVYSSFLLHATRAAERFGVSEKQVLLEAGRRQAVGGQEDLLPEIAAELAGAGKAAHAHA